MTHQIAVQLGWSTALIGVSFFVHGAMIVLGRLLYLRPTRRHGVVGILSDTGRLTVVAIWLFIAHVIVIWMWGWLYIHTGVSATWEEAIYFSLTTYTTLGFGDIVPPADWRLLTGASSANGLLLFGLSAAVLVDTTDRLRQKPGAMR